MATTFVEWQGLTKLILDMTDTIPRNAARDISTLNRELGETTLQLYKDNLSGSVPSTDDNPLPVGIDSSDLISGARLRIVNQYAFEVYNDSGHSGWIEDGTINFAPRQPLANAVQQIEQTLEVTLDEVLVGIIE